MHKNPSSIGCSSTGLGISDRGGLHCLERILRLACGEIAELEVANELFISIEVKECNESTSTNNWHP